MNEKLPVLIKIEWIKTRHYRAFKILSLVYVVLLVLVFIGAQRFINNITIQSNDDSFTPFRGLSFYQTKYIWQNFTYIAGYLKIIPALLIILLITNEFSFFTMRQQLISGLSRKDFLTGKLLVISALIVGIVILIALTALVLGLLHQQVGDVSLLNGGLWFLPLHALELLTYLIFSMMIAFIFRRSGIATIVFVLYALIGERIVSFILPGSIGDYLPLNAAGSLIPLPNNTLTSSIGLTFRSTVDIQTILSCVIYCFLFTAIIYFLLRWRDA
ncbi:MAG: ABC transporter permease subunit [Lentimicrobium sp.]|jgi:ABC-type transport system involved in multi-copper enzyme maturation permease subunit|nr:ABC transporter permease subunit [Lentimicrobium sp.]MDD2526831.1 ABC transporter permease subunit [Lentimicrobiaceae bacterium]MDD4598101.1 ABC transporter permease subunit [Lentimicrobiaceae bacterium]MDY0024444.1 ABC transporter permease subunit [Lentimicrobium sp.]